MTRAKWRWLALTAALSASPAFGGETAVTGVVSDRTGAHLSGIEVTLQPRSGGAAVRTTSDPAGRFEFPAVAEGAYELTAGRAGLRTLKQDVQVTASKPARLELSIDAAHAESVTVTATRLASPVGSLPASATVLTRDAVETQAVVSPNLTEVLAKTLPGTGMSRETEATFGQALRGRDMLVLVDGVPQNFELRIGATDELARIDASAVERIEVVRGASAAYGASAAGGIVSITTRQDVGPSRARTELGGSLSTEHAGDSFRKRVGQEMGGRFTKGSFRVNGALDHAGSDFDAEGDRIPQLFLGPNSTTWNLGGSLAYEVGPRQTLRLSGGFLRSGIREFFGPANAVVGSKKAEAVALPLGAGSVEDQPSVPLKGPYKRQQTYTLEYRHEDLLGSRVTASASRLSYVRRNIYDDFFGGQLQPDFDKSGLRLDVDTPLGFAPFGSRLLWGADGAFYHHEEFFSNGAPLVSPIDQRGGAIFAQATVPAGNTFLFRGGARHERFSVEIDDFTTHPGFGGVSVEGGTLDYDATTFNAGVVWFAGRNVELFGGFSQGFSITEVGRLVSRTRLATVAEARPEAQKIDNYELGARWSGRQVQLTLSAFRSESELGTNFFINPSTGIPEILRAPEETNGVEATFDAQPSTVLQLGGTFTWQKGEHDPDRDGAFTPMPGFRISPVKVTAYAQHQTAATWRNRLQATYGGPRDEFPGSTNFGEGRVGEVFLVDLFSAVDLPKGTLRVGISNLLDCFYIPQANQAFNFDGLYIAGRGRTVTASYVLTW